MLVLNHGRGSQVHLDTKDGRITLKIVRSSPNNVSIAYALPDSVYVTRENAKVKKPRECN